MAGFDASETAAAFRSDAATAAGLASGSPTAAPAAMPGPAPVATKPPLYWRALRLRQMQPNGWQRAVLVEGVIGVSVILVLADVASAWTLLVLPVTSAAVVKVHDVLSGMLPRRERNR